MNEKRMVTEQEELKKTDGKNPSSPACSCDECEPDFLESSPAQASDVVQRKKGPDISLIRIGVGSLIFVAGFIFRNLEYSFLIFIAAYFVLGFEVFIDAARSIVKGKIFDENFLMLIASAGAMAIGEFPEAAGVMLFYSVGEFLQDRAVDRSKRSIKSLLSIKPDYANIHENGVLIQVSPEEVAVGSIILVKPGEKVPLDGEIIEGFSTLDTSALTGEFLPREVEAGDSVLSGSINITGVLKVRVTTPFSESTASRILKLISEASEHKAPTENFITRFARYYTPAVVGLAALIMIVPSLASRGGLTRE
jgi:Cd2+/Zn2+-exporting ATPase